MKNIIIVFIFVISAQSPCLADDYAQIIENASNLYSQGNYRETIELLDSAPQKVQDSDTRFLRLRGSAEYKLGNNEEAGKLYQKALDLGDESVLVGLSFVKINNNDFDWLIKNKDHLQKHIKKDDDMMRVFAVWAAKTKDLKVFEDGLSEITDEQIASNPRVALVVLKTHRFILNDALMNARTEDKK